MVDNRAIARLSTYVNSKLTLTLQGLTTAFPRRIYYIIMSEAKPPDLELQTANSKLQTKKNGRYFNKRLKKVYKRVLL